MSFTTDKQTLDDLNITGRFKQQSLFNIFNRTQTSGGEKLLGAFFDQPMSDPSAINRRSETIRYFYQNPKPFPLNKQTFGDAESYLTSETAGSLVAGTASLLKKKILHLAVKDQQFAELQKGVGATIEVLRCVHDFLQDLDKDISQDICKSVSETLADARIKELLHTTSSGNLTLMQLAQYDHLLRKIFRRQSEQLLSFIYELDVYMAVGNVARARNFSFAEALPQDRNVFKATALWHPALEKAVPNMIALDGNENVLFLTGANMAGKSTFMKSIGLAIYLAHMGFPVSAAGMQFSVRDGLYTSINVADNLALGYSHFYAEVLRVKKVAQEVAKGSNLIVIFDELFKGTNVKDAYEATLAVTQEFATYRNSLFVISTHITEVGEKLRESVDNVQFSFLPTIMEGRVPRYPYTLTPGITNDRHGMLIIENEKLLDLIQG